MKVFVTHDQDMYVEVFKELKLTRERMPSLFAGMKELKICEYSLCGDLDARYSSSVIIVIRSALLLLLVKVRL